MFTKKPTAELSEKRGRGEEGKREREEMDDAELVWLFNVPGLVNPFPPFILLPPPISLDNFFQNQNAQRTTKTRRVITIAFYQKDRFQFQRKLENPMRNVRLKRSWGVGWKAYVVVLFGVLCICILFVLSLFLAHLVLRVSLDIPVVW